MCLGIPYEVVEVQDQDSCLVKVGSGVQHCFTGLVDDVAPGDWLVVHAGFAVERITAEDARLNLDLITRYVFGDEGALRAQAQDAVARSRVASPAGGEPPDARRRADAGDGRGETEPGR